MDTSTAADALTSAARERARAEAREIRTMLAYRDREIARTVNVEPPMRRQVERAAIAMTIGEAAGLSEGQVHQRLSAAQTVRDHAPTTWAAFGDGLVDWARVRDIAHTIDQLRRPESVERLDRRVVDYAVDHTAAELRAYLQRFVRRVKADLAIERAEAARRDRHVSVNPTDDSMSWLNAYLPSHEAAAIADRLHRAARRDTDPDDTRTIAQREADLLVAWCTDSPAATSAVDANIAVTIDADVLTGVRDGFAESTDGRWGVPAAWVTDLAHRGNTFWHRMLLDPVTGDVLSHEYVGRFCPRDHGPSGARQAPGRSPAATQSLERRGTSRAPHRVPHPDGPTSADNLGPLCRRHHVFKGHGVLRWSTGPPQRPSPFVVEIWREPVAMAYAA